VSYRLDGVVSAGPGLYLTCKEKVLVVAQVDYVPGNAHRAEVLVVKIVDRSGRGTLLQLPHSFAFFVQFCFELEGARLLAFLV